ncbi:MAG TPA: hypothetical protein EYO65_06260 [Nitrospirales bacterium]|nr:hypothetical protein [Nitrospirales bacterium]HIC05106.1 hypothetical protein [Nitrospirales bacterium]HIN32584.1 hypothetical protein [Nitrospirales bacterium]
MEAAFGGSPTEGLAAHRDIHRRKKLDDIKLSLNKQATTVKFALSLKIGRQGETAEVGIVFDDGVGSRPHGPAAVVYGNAEQK